MSRPELGSRSPQWSEENVTVPPVSADWDLQSQDEGAGAPQVELSNSLSAADQYLQSEAIASAFFAATNSMEPGMVGKVSTDDARYVMPYAPCGLPQLFEGKLAFLDFISTIKQGAEKVDPESPVLYDIRLNATTETLPLCTPNGNLKCAYWPLEFFTRTLMLDGSRSQTTPSANL